MAQIISGPGVGLPPPQSLYPPNLVGVPQDVPCNYIGLSPGDELPFPSTNATGWIVDAGAVSVVEWLDPTTGIWRQDQRPPGGLYILTNDGFTRRISNLTGCPIAAVVTGGGSGFAQSTAEITANIGGSTWLAIVGGSLSVSTISNPGSGYTMAPLVHIKSPGVAGTPNTPNGAIPATAYATITSGTVSSVSLQDFGAGYLAAPAAAILPNPSDPNFGSIVNASVTLVLNAAQSTAITGALVVNHGAPLTSSLTGLTLTAAGGAGTGATLAAVVMQCVQSVSVVAGGGGFGNVAAPAGGTTIGGQYAGAASVSPNPMVEMTKFRPRPAQFEFTSSAAGAISAPVLVDPGLFVGTPTAVILSSGTIPTTLASVALTMGVYQDTVNLQPL